jgi:outer membrane lipoprotein-sorting protein
MTNAKPQEPTDVLERATEALRIRSDGATPPVAVVDRAVAALEGRTSAEKPFSPERKFWNMKTIFGTSIAGGLAAGIAIAVIWNLFPQGTGLAFADVLQNVRQVQSAKMKVHMVVAIGGETSTPDGIMYIDGPNRRIRQELQFPYGQVINIFDLKAGKGLMLSPDAKTAVRLDVAHMPKNQAPQDFLAEMQKLQETPTKDLGEKDIEGRRLHGFLSVKNENETVTETTIWADGRTKMPVVVEMTIRNGFVPAKITMSDFEWNWPIDESLLKLEVPEGYAVSDAPYDMGKPMEKDVVAALKASTAFNAGKFPAGLTMKQLAQSMYESLADKTQMKQKITEQNGNLLVVAHGWAYISDPQNGSDWHWAGAGVGLGEKDQPVLWYKPAGKETFTVFDADLSIHSETQEPSAPSVLIDTAPATPPGK